jgi:pimeloyl-ACP methyl ester carboxylesterase
LPPSTGKGLKRFYDQKLSWADCNGGSFQCATLTVPLDYAKPTGKTLGIAVIRQPSAGSHEGSLIVNPGGPGASGVDFVAQTAASFAELTEHDDLVSFDPRGVGASTPIRCVSSSDLDAYINENPNPQTAAERATVVAQAERFANACYRKNGNYLEHVGTIDEARDMNVLRAALGDRKLTYYGASYGTYLGAKYAQLFPNRIRAMVLDGALDPTQSVTQENLVQAKGFQVDLNDFLAQCVQSGKCPLGSTVTAAHAEIDNLRQSVTANPPPTATGRVLGPGEFFEGLASGLYQTSVWPELWASLGLLKEGHPDTLFLFADALTGRNSDGSYTNLI